MPSPRVTLDQWNALVAVVEAGSYARAAELLNRSQSSVTYAVQQIQSQLGVVAFELEGRKARLTPTGEQLYQRARYLVAEAAALESASACLSLGWEAELRLAVEVIYPNQRLFACLERFGQSAEHTRVEVVEEVLGHNSSLLENGAIELGMPLASLLAVAGTPRNTTLLEGSAAASYDFDGFTVAAHDTVYWIIVDSPVYRTAEGAAVGAEQIEARAAFGKPACVVTRGDHTLYDYGNIYVEVSNATGRVTQIGVQKKTGTCR